MASKVESLFCNVQSLSRLSAKCEPTMMKAKLEKHKDARRGSVKKPLTTVLAIQGFADISTWYVHTILLWTGYVQSSNVALIIQNMSSTTVYSPPAKGIASGTLECGTWSVYLLVSGRSSKEAFTMHFEPYIQRAVSVHDQRYHFCPAAAVDKNWEATKITRQEHIGFPRFSLLFQGRFITTSYACIGTALNSTNSTSTRRAQISTR